MAVGFGGEAVEEGCVEPGVAGQVGDHKGVGTVSDEAGHESVPQGVGSQIVNAGGTSGVCDYVGNRSAAQWIAEAG